MTDPAVRDAAADGVLRAWGWDPATEREQGSYLLPHAYEEAEQVLAAIAELVGGAAA